jgi:hypothetical protein
MGRRKQHWSRILRRQHNNAYSTSAHNIIQYITECSSHFIGRLRIIFEVYS